ncbi:hypothetical protein [Klebsiella pneumoniae IS46]|nr:hypothetical protein [Klebsiella pneumoniae IS46]
MFSKWEKIKVITFLIMHFMTKGCLVAFYLYQMTTEYDGGKVAAES